MGTEGGVRPKWLWGSIFEPATDFYEMLNRHARTTLDGLEALHDWITSEHRDERCQRVRDLENEADVLKLELGKKLFEAFITPFDREDIFDLCHRMDEVINGAKSVVRELDTFDIDPQATPNLPELIEILVEGTRHLTNSITSLQHNLPQASEQALLARKAENKFTKAYRAAMKQLFEIDDVKLILRTKEVYRTLLLVSEKIDVVGERLQQIIIKMS